jgi:thiol-disulfide isomerase/thioredoxin
MKRLLAFGIVLFFASETLFAFQVKQKAPNFSLKTAKGTSFQLSKLKGKVVLVNFWATWCGPCREEIPGFLELYSKYKSQGLEIVGISLDENGWEDINPFVQKFKITYPIVLGNEKVAKDYGDIYGLPTSFVVDKKGFIVDKHIGYLTKELLEEKIKDLF